VAVRLSDFYHSEPSCKHIWSAIHLNKSFLTLLDDHLNPNFFSQCCHLIGYSATEIQPQETLSFLSWRYVLGLCSSTVTLLNTPCRRCCDNCSIYYSVSPCSPNSSYLNDLRPLAPWISPRWDCKHRVIRGWSKVWKRQFELRVSIASCLNFYLVNFILLGPFLSSSIGAPTRRCHLSLSAIAGPKRSFYCFHIVWNLTVLATTLVH